MNPLEDMNLLAGVSGGILNTVPKAAKPSTGNRKRGKAYSPSYTKLTAIPKEYCRILNSSKQLAAISMDIDAPTNMRLLSYIVESNPTIKALLPTLTFEGLHINSRGIYIDYQEGAGIHILPRSNWKREVIIFDNNEDEVLRETFDSSLTITLENLSLEFEELGLDIEDDDTEMP